MIGPDINEINLCLKDTVLQMGKKIKIIQQN